MKTRALLQALLDSSGYNANSLSNKLNGATTQPQIHKFLKGQVAEPKRRTLQPVADFFGISVEAFFDEELAEQLLTQIRSGTLKPMRNQRAMTTGRGASMPATPPHAWPFVSVSEDDWALLSEFQRGSVEGYVKALMTPNHVTHTQAKPLSGIASEVIGKKLTTESSDVFKKGVTKDAADSN